jgi:hypothetical protein
MQHLAALLLLATAVSARADAVADLKRTLATLRGASAIAATYESRQTNKARGRFFNQNLNVHSVADVQAGAGGVTVTLSRATLDRLRAQRAAGRRDDEDGSEQSGEVAAGRVAELLDYAPTLQAMLARAVLRSERDTAVGGVPARLLVFKVPPERSRAKDVKVETSGDDLTLWVGRDGVPLAAQRKAQFSVGFLFLKATGGATEKWTFVRRDDRLVVTRHERAGSGGGMGQSTEASETQSIVVR